MAAAERSLSKSGGVHWPDISAISIRFSNTEVGSFVFEALKAYQATKDWNRAQASPQRGSGQSRPCPTFGLVRASRRTGASQGYCSGQFSGLQVALPKHCSQKFRRIPPSALRSCLGHLVYRR